MAIDKRQRYLDRLKGNYPFVDAQVVDATAMPFPDGEFDLVVCNAVLEHVPEIAKRIASEIRRVGKRYFVAVPYRYAIVESHYRLPFLGLLKPKQMDWVVTNLCRLELHNDPIVLPTRCDMRRLFPDADLRMVWAAGGLFASVVAIR